MSFFSSWTVVVVVVVVIVLVIVVVVMKNKHSNLDETKKQRITYNSRKKEKKQHAE